MKILIDEVKKELQLVKNDGTVVSTYPYKNVISDNFTLEDLKRNNEAFNKTLAQQEEFDSIKGLTPILKIHNFEE